jgi:hypothetical protein
VAGLLEEGKDRETDDIIKKVAGGLNHLVYSTTGNYECSPITSHAVFASLYLAKGVTRENSDELYYLALMSQFKRQRNRLVDGLCGILDDIDLQLYRWKAAAPQEDNKKGEIALLLHGFLSLNII